MNGWGYTLLNTDCVCMMSTLMRPVCPFQAFKSWYQLASDGTFCEDKVLVDRGLAPGGKDKGYWVGDVIRHDAG